MRTISVADYFVEFLIANEITDVFGYQGGMIAYIFDSLGKYKDKIRYHSCATEQGAALAACGYAQASHKIGVAISTSGPGFTNMLTGIANAWFDSVPVLFISGNVNTKDKKRGMLTRQLGFQEIQAAQMAAPISKKVYEFELDTDYVACLQEAYCTALTKRKGPVYIDLPINVCRETVTVDEIKTVTVPDGKQDKIQEQIEVIVDNIAKSKRPLIIAGAGIKQVGAKEEFRKLIELMQIPVASTLPAVDILPSTSKYMLGYIGGTARREAEIALQNADFVLSIGTRLCSKQVGHNMSLFAPKAKTFVRVDIDESEFERKLKDNELQIKADAYVLLKEMLSYTQKNQYKPVHEKWVENCDKIYNIMQKVDITQGNLYMKKITDMLPDDANIVLDVGKNMTYGGQSSRIKNKTEVYMSAGLGTMGYSLPAAIGAYYGNHRPTVAFMGDGGAQMNIQELNTIVKNKLPIKVVVFNNKALGNIRIFQEQYLNSHFVATMESEGDYFSCDFSAIANAYGMDSVTVDDNEELEKLQNKLRNSEPALIEIIYKDCEVLPGIVAGGNYLDEETGIDDITREEIVKLLK